MKNKIYGSVFACLVAGVLLTGCTDADMASFDEGYNNAGSNRNAGVDLMGAARDCKSYMADRFPDFPNAAFSIDGYAAYNSNGVVHVPVNFKWDEPFVEERGECIVVNGIVKNYRRTSN